MGKGGKSGPAGGASWDFDGEKMQSAIAAGAADGGLRILLEIQIEIRKNLSKRGSGIKYWGNRTTSSAPGEPPAAQTGTLRNSWQTGKPNKTIAGSRISWALGSAVRYAKLEFGFGRALPRPYIQPAVDTVGRRAGKIMNAYINAAIKKAFTSKPAP